jgi:DNA-binding YbaB/EbfC family protein
MDMMKMMQQAKQMQEKMQTMTAELDNVEVTGSAGGGMVKATMTCKGHMRGLEIAPEVIDPAEPEILQDLIIAAVNDARAKGEQTLADRTKDMMSSMGLPADIKLPF